MKLLAEVTETVEVITEEKEGTKNLYIQGPFMMYGIPNRNKRVYPESVMKNEVDRYIKEHVNNKRAFGELNHPQGPTINLDRVSHLIESLDFQPKGIVWGKAKIVNTPVGGIVKGLLESGASLGVSSRALGSLRDSGNGLSEVQNDFKIVTAADIVADPSAHIAYVKGIMENVDYYYDTVKGTFAERVVEQQHEQMKKMSTKQILETKEFFFKQILDSLVKK